MDMPLQLASRPQQRNKHNGHMLPKVDSRRVLESQQRKKEMVCRFPRDVRRVCWLHVAGALKSRFQRLAHGCFMPGESRAARRAPNSGNDGISLIYCISRRHDSGTHEDVNLWLQKKEAAARREEKWKAKMERSPFHVDQLAEQERIDEVCGC